MSTVPDLSHEFAGRRAVVTGGTKGIGAAIAQRFLDAGGTVVVTARSESEDTPAGAAFITSDLRSNDGATQFAAKALEVLGGLDILVNNAGAARVHLGGAVSIPDEEWVDSLNINFLSAIRVTNAFLPALRESSHAAIINLAAGATSAAPGPLLQYVAAKQALITYTKGLAQELAPSGIRANVVTPGPVVTPGSDVIRDTIAGAMGVTSDVLVSQVPLRRNGEAFEVAEMAALLASDRGSWLTSANFFVDGGTGAL
jgi:NAD(P)-dependent dehydrogenase (short-subunit alcohol dehydrogenase family)